MIVVMREALIKTAIRLVANATAKKILWGDNVPVANQISLDFPIVNSVIVHQLHNAMKKQVRFKKYEIVMGPFLHYVSTGLWDPPPPSGVSIFHVLKKSENIHFLTPLPLQVLTSAYKIYEFSGLHNITTQTPLYCCSSD